MATLTAPQFLDSARPLLDGPGLRDAESLSEQSPAVDHIATELVRRKRLTQFQADELLHGRGNGLVLGAYILLEPIGKGGMGQVFRARQKVLERDCAVKIIRQDRLQSEESVERFLREARVAARLKHPNIVAIYDANVADGVHYLAMELLNGETLADVVKAAGPLAIGRACRYVLQAAMGLQHAYEQGLVHRDIKPQNLFLEKASDQIKILDLGLARIRETPTNGETVTGDLTREGEVMGTPDYMAPEQALASRSADHRADIYSLGCTLYFLLTGRPPFPGGSLTEKLLAHQQREPVAMEHLRGAAPDRLIHALKKAMAKQPEDRFQTPAEFAQALAPLESAEQFIAMGPTVTAIQDTLPGRKFDTTTMPSRDIVKSRSSTTVVLVILSVVAAIACCPLVIVGIGFLGAGALVLTPAREDHVHQMPVKMPEPIDLAAPGPPPIKVKPPDEKIIDTGVTEVKKFDGRDFALSRDGKWMILNQSATTFNFEVREFESGKRRLDVQSGHEAWGFAFGDSPRFFITKDRMTFLLLQLEDGTELERTNNPFGAFSEYVASDDEKTALVSTGKDLVVWDLMTLKQKQRVRLPDFPQHISYCSSKELGLAFCNKRLQTWSLPNDIAEREYVGFAGGNIMATAISPDGMWIAAGDGTGGVHLWKADQPTQPRHLDDGHAGSIKSVVFSADSARLLSGCAGGRLAYWEVGSAKKIQSVVVGSGLTRVDIHPDGRRGITASNDKKLRIWRLPR